MTAPVTRANVMKEAITVVCRIRPLNQAERMKGSTSCVKFHGPSSVSVGGKTYTFDVVLPPTATQTDVYERSAKSIVSYVLNGYNGTIFAYGQTASGKTYTMEGRIKDTEHKGIIPRIIEDLFLYIEKMDGNLEFLIKVSYFELYMEKIKDLLDITKTNLPIHETKEKVAYVKGVTERFVSSAEDILDILDEGKMNRHVSVTNMNEHSSRSHSIFRICIRQNNRETGKQLIGSLHLVDLAGSEKVSRTGAEGSTLDEARNINKSLSTLGNVINALVEGSTHVPYRDSKLTRILQQSLGGNSKTTIIIAASPAVSNELETKSTMTFGMRAKAIKNQVTLNLELTAEEWKRLYEREADRCKQLFQALNTLDEEISQWREGNPPDRNTWFTKDQFGKAYTEMTQDSNENVAMTLTPGDPTSGPISQYLPSVAPMQHLGRPAMPETELVDASRVTEMFRLLDEKDDEINKLCQKVTKLEHQLFQTKEEYGRIHQENDHLQTSLEKMQRETDVRRSEIKDVLQALEELAVTYDEKNTECRKCSAELEQVTGELGRVKEQLDACQLETDELRAGSSVMRDRVRELLYDLNLELHELGLQMNKLFAQTPPDKSICLEEQAAVLKLYVIQIKSELQNLRTYINPTDGISSQLANNPSFPRAPNEEVARKLKEFEERLNDAKQVSDRKQRTIQTLQSELEQTNQRLMEQEAYCQVLNEIEKANGMSEPMLEQIRHVVDKVGGQMQHQMAQARGDVDSLWSAADRLREENITLKLQLERFVTEAETLHRQTHGGDKDDQTANELKSMEDAVLHELGVLHSLRRTFITELKSRMKKHATTDPLAQEDEPIESQTLGSSVQRERINFLKTSLDNLTKVHKQLVRDNADLRCDIPKLEKRVKASMERIKDLEVALRESKEQMIRDRRRYHQEVERLKEANWARGNARILSNIIKPIRPGQQKDAT